MTSKKQKTPQAQEKSEQAVDQTPGVSNENTGESTQPAVPAVTDTGDQSPTDDSEQNGQPGTGDQSSNDSENQQQPAAQEQTPAVDPGAATDKDEDKAAENASPKTTGGYVDAVLKSRRCSGGRCKEKGETMRMTRGEYERLKKYDRVE